MLQIKSQKASPSVPPLSMYGLFSLSCFRHLDDVVVDEKALQFTRRDMKRDVHTLAKALLQLGVDEGDIVMIYSGRSMYANVVIFFALNRLGAVACYRDEATDEANLIQDIEKYRPHILFTYQQPEEWIHAIQKQSSSLWYVINMTSPHDQKIFDQSILETFYLDATPITAIAADYTGKVPKHFFDSKKEALISFTSGSTSGPKPIVFTDGGMIASAIYSKVASDVKMWDKERHSWMSYVHLDCPYGMMVSVLAPICGGGMVIMTPDITNATTSEYFRKGPNTVFGVPRLLQLLPELLDDDVDLSSLRMLASGGERLDENVSLALREYLDTHGATQATICNGYGTGETAGLISTAVGKKSYRPDSVGIVPAGVHVAVIDPSFDPKHPETIKELGFNQVGIICAGGKHCMARYYERPDLDAEKLVILDGERFIVTGDIGYIEEDGRTVLVGRDTLFLNDRRSKVYYEIVRTAVSQSPYVKECSVVKGPHATLGLGAYAFVVLNDGVEPTDQTRQAILDQTKQPFRLGDSEYTLAYYEVPIEIVFLDALPLTPKDKIDFHKLEDLAQEVGAAYAAEYAANLRKK